MKSLAEIMTSGEPPTARWVGMCLELIDMAYSEGPRAEERHALMEKLLANRTAPVAELRAEMDLLIEMQVRFHAAMVLELTMAELRERGIDPAIFLEPQAGDNGR